MKDGSRSDASGKTRRPQSVPMAVWVTMLVLLTIAGALVFLSATVFRSTPPNPNPPSSNAPATTPLESPAAEPSTPRPDATNPPSVSGSSDASITQLAAQLRDGTLPLRIRRQAARALARIGTDEALAALKAALEDSSPALRAAIVESLGESPHPLAREWLREWVRHPDEAIAVGAVRGLALRGDVEAAELLGSLLFNDHLSAAVRTEAATALGELNFSEATASLARAMKELTYAGNEELVESILDGLAQRPFAETESIFRDYLDSPNVPSEQKIQALESLLESEGDVASFLMKYVADSDPEVRLAAAEALGMAETETDISARLFELLKAETDPRIRAELYRALANQEQPDASAILALAQNESDAGARLAALQLLAKSLRTASNPTFAAFFNQTAVPELQRAALVGGSVSDRVAAIAALSRAGTPPAMTALQEIARTANDPHVAQTAQQALQISRFIDPTTGGGRRE